MKNHKKKSLSLQKLTIARIQESEMYQLKGGDCIPTDPHMCFSESDCYCHTKDIP